MTMEQAEFLCDAVSPRRNKLKVEINTKLDALQAAGEQMIPRRVTHAICTVHESALAEDSEHSDFWRHGGYMHTRRMVTECINKRCDGTSKSTGDQQQLSLPCFDWNRLQDFYIVERDGEEVAVCILDMTDGELKAKARHHEAISSANAAHAREIRRFIAWRIESSMTIAPATPIPWLSQIRDCEAIWLDRPLRTGRA
jgi:hypothetical protein